MSVFSRIADIFRANVNDALDKAEDPEKMIKQMVIDMEESVNEATHAVGKAIANEKNLERKMLKARTQADEWNKKAMQAVQAGRDDLAKAALEKKAASQRNVTDLEPSYQAAKQTANKMRDQLNMLKSKLEEARSRQSTLIARSQAAKAQKQISQSFSGVGSDAFGKFDKFEAKVEQIESEAEAFEQLADGDVGLEEEFRQLDAGTSSDADLLALKASMGLLDSPASDDSSKEEQKDS